MVLGQPEQKCMTLSEKLTKAKRAGVVAQVVACLPSICKALSSNPSTNKKNLLVHFFMSVIILFKVNIYIFLSFFSNGFSSLIFSS
jgi:hypothetical protein